MYFDSYDCASFVIRALNKFDALNATILPDVHLNYTRVNLYSAEPELLGTYEQIMQNKTLHRDFVEFYQEFQNKKRGATDWFVELLDLYETFFLFDRFYLYFNNVYWYLKLHSPKLHVTFNEEPITAILKRRSID
mgnify:CR=1 FL=1